MSPSSQQINGVRPPPLSIDKGSHAIHKSSSSSSAAITAASRPRQRRSPVIIYAHSPKVIHTEPRYFKALVQKLTGCPRSADDDPTSASSLLPPPTAPPSSNGDGTAKRNKDDVIVDDYSNSCGGVAASSSSAVSDVSSSTSSEICSDVRPPVAFEQQLKPSNRFSPGVSPFTPSSSDLFSPSRPLFSPSVSGGGLSPSVLEALRTFLEE